MISWLRVQILPWLISVNIYQLSPIHRVMASLPDEQHYTESLAPARWMVGQIQDQYERLVGPPEDPKGEPIELDWMYLVG